MTPGQTRESPGEVPQEGAGGGGAARHAWRAQDLAGGMGERRGCGQPTPLRPQPRPAPHRALPVPQHPPCIPLPGARASKRRSGCSTVPAHKAWGVEPESGQSALGSEAEENRGPGREEQTTPPQGEEGAQDPRWVSPDPRGERSLRSPGG